MKKGDTISVSEPSFNGYAARIYSIQDFSDALNMARTNPELESSNHHKYDYRFGNEDKCKQNFDSEENYGVGLHMLEYMIDNITDCTILIATHRIQIHWKAPNWKYSKSL